MVRCYQIAKSFGDFDSVRPIVRISSAWRYRNVRASAYFEIRVFRGGISTSAGETSVEHDDHLVNPSVKG